MHKTRPKNGTLGFTLVELMIVISVMLILMSIAIPMYQRSIIHSKETVLRQDLSTIRHAIEEYTGDKRKAPESLQDLIAAGYLKALPKDPFTDSAETWATQTMDLSQVDASASDTGGDGATPQLDGITDVHSGSNATAIDGTAYADW